MPKYVRIIVTIYLYWWVLSLVRNIRSLCILFNGLNSLATRNRTLICGILVVLIFLHSHTHTHNSGNKHALALPFTREKYSHRDRSASINTYKRHRREIGKPSSSGCIERISRNPIFFKIYMETLYIKDRGKQGMRSRWEKGGRWGRDQKKRGRKKTIERREKPNLYSKIFLGLSLSPNKMKNVDTSTNLILRVKNGQVVWIQLTSRNLLCLPNPFKGKGARGTK